jgi:hypothetical protein
MIPWPAVGRINKRPGDACNANVHHLYQRLLIHDNRLQEKIKWFQAAVRSGVPEQGLCTWLS